MDPVRRSVLLVGFDEARVRRLLSLLGSFDMNLHYLPWSEGLSGVVKMREFDAIVLRLPRERRQLTSLLEALRVSEAVNLHTGVVLVAGAGELGKARAYLTQGVNRVVRDDAAGEGLREALVPLLSVAHRIRLRAQVELSALVGAQPMTAYCQTENLSISGMLVSCAHPLPIGAPIDFSLSVPGEDGPIRGTARVVRLTNPHRERVLGMAATFESFVENHRSRLRSVLLRQAS